MLKNNGSIRLTVAETETDKNDERADKNGYTGLCEGILVAQRQRTTQIPIGFCIGLGLGHCQSD